MCWPNRPKSVINWDATNGINEWEPKGPQVITDVILDSRNDDPTTQQCDRGRTFRQRQERIDGTMVTVPERFQVKPKTVVYAYNRWQPRFDRMQKQDGIRFHRGLPNPSHLTKWFGPTSGGVLVLDDLMEEGDRTNACWICSPKIPITATSPCCT